MIRKKLLSVCLALALCLSLLPTMALADDTHSDHAVCVSEGNCTNSDHADSHGTVTWTAWTDIDSLPNSTGSYYLTADVTISATWEVPTGKTQLCLNGHTIKYENSTAQGSVIKVPDEATLTITDCASTPGKITGGTGTDTNYSNTSPILSDSYFGGGIFVEGTLNLYGGNIEGNRIPSDNSPRHGGGGGIFVNGTNACFNMYGGVVQDNEAYGAGAGVLCYQSRFNMYGGEITKHSQKVYNGAVCLDTGSTMTMTGGTIAGNIGSDEQIYICKDANLIVAGDSAVIAETSDQSAIYAFNGGEVEIKNGNIRNEIALVQKSKLTMSEGAVQDIRVSRGSSVMVSGGKINQGITVGSDDSDYFGWGTVTLSGAPEISGINLANENNVIIIGGELTYSTPIPVTKGGGVLTRDWSTYMNNTTAADYFNCGEYELQQISKELHLVSPGDHVDGSILFDNDLQSLDMDKKGSYVISESKNYYLSNVYTIGNSSSIEPTLFIGDGTSEITVNLCLNGYCLTRPQSHEVDSPVIIVRENATLNLYDCEDTGAITGGKGRTAKKDGNTYSYGGGILVYGTLNMYGGSITGNSANSEGVASGFGGGVYVAPGGSFTMSGGSITNNTAKTTGGGVTVAGAGDAVPVSAPLTTPVTVGGGSDDGVIDSWKDGGTVEGSAELQSLSLAASAPINSTAASFTLSGGSITGNAAEIAGGVNVRGVMTVGSSSAITVTRNTAGESEASNVYFPEPHTDITVNSIPTDGTSIGVRMAAPGQFAAMGSDVDEVQAKLFFTSDDVDYNVLAMQDGLKLGKQHSAPNIQIDYQDETLTGFDASASYTINGEAVIPEADGTIAIKRDWFGTSISIVQKGDGDVADSEAQSLNIPARPVAPDVTGGTLKINGADTTMEYSTDHGATWTAFTDETVSSITAGAYLVRVAPVAGISFASENTEVTVAQRSSGGVVATYNVTVEDTEHGTVTARPTRPTRGQTVTITTDPDEGYEVGTVTVTDRNGNRVTVEDNGDGTYTFTQPGSNVTVFVTFREMDEVANCPHDETCPMYGFTDLNLSAWYHDGIHYCLENGLMIGTGDDIFSPDGTTTRAQIVTILWRLEGEPVVNYLLPFDDVASGEWYTEAVRWAASESIVGGYGGGLFGTNDAVTREQLAAILYRYAAYKGYDVSIGEDTNILSYDDFADLSEYAIPAMRWACGAGIVNGTSESTLTPQGEATRAQVAAMLMRFCENIVQ